MTEEQIRAEMVELEKLCPRSAYTDEQLDQVYQSYLAESLNCRVAEYPIFRGYYPDEKTVLGLLHQYKTRVDEIGHLFATIKALKKGEVRAPMWIKEKSKDRLLKENVKYRDMVSQLKRELQRARA